jgi:spermidine synthase
MSRAFEELDFRPTALGDLTLRRRRLPQLDDLEVYEVKLGEEFLMSSLFHDVEVALADLGLADLPGPLDVVVGGLGLGYTAAAALRHDAVRSLLVVDALAPVIEWHERGLVPLGPALTADPRCRFVHGDFFALATAPAAGFDAENSTRRFHAILLDIDHSPENLLHPRHAAFYSPGSLRQLATKLHPGGVFAMWSDDPPSHPFLATLGEVFPDPSAHTVTFDNPLRGNTSSSTVYVARRPDPT